ncbi:MAG: secondary thiamine-phosphate synthase enzyme YjbQ [Candidatus Altiarchaeota archaeon]
MAIVTRSIRLSSEPDGMTDITDELRALVDSSGLNDGIATVFCPGSTGALSTVEFEPGLAKDIPAALERIAPKKWEYAHHLTWGDDNGSGHVRATIIGPSLTIPFSFGKLTLGEWQQAVFIECDSRKRERELVVKLIGE